MKNIITSLCLLSALSIWAQDQFAYNPYPLNIENSLFWKISGNGLTQPSYIYGIMHMVCSEEYHIPQKVKDALNKTNQLYIEVDMNDPELVVKAQSQMMSPIKLSERLSHSEFAYLDSIFIDKMKMSVKALDNVEPAFIYSILMEPFLDCGALSVEEELMKVNKNKNVEGLETFEFQMNILKKNFNYDNLIEGIKDLDSNYFKKMHEAYIKSDLEAITQYAFESLSKQSEDIIQELMFDRNNNWAEQIPDIANSQPTFFAVGAGHLGTDKGVIQLLRNKGYTVIPVK